MSNTCTFKGHTLTIDANGHACIDGVMCRVKVAPNGRFKVYSGLCDVAPMYLARFVALCAAGGDAARWIGYEAHHIIPVSMGGLDSPDNIIFLPVAIHRWVHRYEYR